jgi:very-short-patch-repair endonuclease
VTPPGRTCGHARAEAHHCVASVPRGVAVVEIDGPHHDTAHQRAKHQARDALPDAHSWEVLRFRDTDVRDRPGWVLAQTRLAFARARGLRAA